MKRYISAIFCLFLTVVCNPQILHTSATGSAFGVPYSYNMDVYIPAEPAEPSAGGWPTLIFLPGNGEVGTNRNLLYVNGPLRFIRDNAWRPPFVVAAVQPPAEWPNEIVVDRFLKALVNNPIYKVDPKKIYLTGLSGGAAGIFEYIKNQPEASFISPAAIIPMSITWDAQCGDFYQNTDFLCGTDFRYSRIPGWGFAGLADSHHDKMKRFFDRMIQAGYTIRWTSYQGAHCCWNTFYNPSYTESGKSIYDWMQQFPLQVLPVEWGSLWYNAEKGELEWSTMSEQQNDHFEIEETEDLQTWKTVGTVKSLAIDGNSSTELFYRYKIAS